MIVRFRRSIKILPGVRVNLSGKGATATVGGQRLSKTTSARGTRSTGSLRGTGISQAFEPRRYTAKQPAHASRFTVWMTGILLIVLAGCAALAVVPPPIVELAALGAFVWISIQVWRRRAAVGS